MVFVTSALLAAASCRWWARQCRSVWCVVLSPLAARAGVVGCSLKSAFRVVLLLLLLTQVGPEGAIALAAALKINPVIAYLNLSGTSVGADGGEGAILQHASTQPPQGCVMHTWVEAPTPA